MNVAAHSSGGQIVKTSPHSVVSPGQRYITASSAIARIVTPAAAVRFVLAVLCVSVSLWLIFGGLT